MQETKNKIHQPSWWEISSFWQAIDTAVIGSGIVGLSAAIALKVKHPKQRIAIIERSALPLGASTRNAGFACFGSPTELLDDLQHRPAEEVWALVKKRWEGLRSLRQQLGDTEIGYRDLGGFEVFGEKDDAAYAESIAALPEFNRRLRSLLGLQTVFQEADQSIARFGLGKTRHLIRNRAEGQLDTGKLMRRLLDKARKLEIDIYNGIQIDQWTDTGQGVQLSTQQGWELSCKQLLITTNGLAAHLLPDTFDVRPVRNEVLITKPINRLALRGCFHYDKGYFYFRNVGNRILLGGGRHLAGKGAETDQFGLSQSVQLRLEDLLLDIVAPGVPLQVAHRWSGILGVGRSKHPIIEAVGPRTIVAVRLGGMGIAIGGWVGERAAELLA